MLKFVFLTITLCTTSFLWSSIARADEIKMVVTAAFVSNKGIDVYQDIAGYIGKKLNANVRVISGTSYQEANMLLEQGIIEIGFVCGLPYTQKFKEGKFKLLAIPVSAVKKGQFQGILGYEDVPGKYYSYTIVHKDSPINSWTELKGKSFVYNDQTSNSGYNMPRYKLIQLGARSWEDYFSRIEVSGSHEESIRLVSLGLVDASSVDSLVLDYDRYIQDSDAHNVKIIEVLFPGGAGAPPVVVGSKVSVELRDKLKQAFITMHMEPEGREILGRALLERFDPPSDENYDDVRHMEQIAIDVGFRDHIPR